MIKRYFILIVCIASLLFSCKEDKNSGSTNNDNDKYVNNWIYNNMSFWYLWNTKMPGKPNYALSPEPFFESLLYDRGNVTGDRFSWIQENFIELLDLLQGVTPYDVGFEYVGYSKDEKSTDVLGQIAYVKPNTDAEKIGLKRGDFFTKVNGTTLNTSNWRNLLSGSETSVTITFINMKTGITTNKTVKKEANYAENPVFFNDVYEVDGHKIGYLVYNFFAAGPTQNDYSYDKKLNDVFGSFKSAGITELVLDLRYNSGGSMNSATLLASMIVPNLNTNDIFTQLEFNSLVQPLLIEEYGEDEIIDKLRDKLNTAKGGENSGEAINNAGGSIQKLYVLTGRWTASASELVINGLEPYMPGKIFLIGTTTVGKNVGSISLYEEKDPKNKWGMQPIVLRYFNKDGKADFLSGFTPDIEEKDNDDKLSLGDPDELMLKIAIDHITGTYVPPAGLKSGVSGKLTFGSSVERKAWANTAIFDGSLLKKLNTER
jgi:C-terminal processing protease CtpA/Prc